MRRRVAVSSVRHRRGGVRRAGGDRIAEFPVAATVGQALEADHRLHQHQRTHLDLAGQQRRQGDTHFQRLQTGQPFGLATRRIRQTHLLGGQSRCRQQGQADVTGDGEVSAGLRFDLPGDLILVGVPVDKGRQDEHRTEGERQQQSQTDRDLPNQTRSSSESNQLRAVKRCIFPL